MSEEPEETDEDGPFTCWCGAVGCFEEMFDFTDSDDGCGGAGYIQCQCGGDQCVCHHHGEYECPGCEDCEGERDEFYGDDDEL